MGKNLNRKYFTIHQMSELKKNNFSIVLANIENEEYRIKKAKELYNDEDYHFIFHNDKINISPCEN